MPALGERLKTRWLSQNVPIGPGVTEKEIAAFEDECQVRLPEDVKDYFRTVNGTGPGIMDENHFSFLPLYDVRGTTYEVIGSRQFTDYSTVPQPLAEPERYFVFVDFLISSHFYALYLSSDPSNPAPVIWVADTHFSPMSPSFREFVEAYLTDPDSIL